ncbi:MAG TPA: penicillin-binding transpeptidase domain-containing protein [Candidatus Acidoferrum sp.]|nr:penicillin-binding transpeptidase domain-containing protein [Candidatus Acidoferrum sp.]
MKGRAGAMVVVEVETGNIVAANGFELAAHRLERPGSTVKPFVLMELLESGKMKAKHRLQCRRPLWIGGVRMDCAHPASVLDLDAEEAIAYSCNSYFAEGATRLDAGELVQVFKRAGFDSPSGLATDETTGHIEVPREVSRLQLEALGDRGIEVTPLELLAAYRRLAMRVRDGSLEEIDKPVFEGLEGSIEYGMAHAANVPGMKIAGKTGTAASNEGAKTHGFFAGFAPAEKPEIAIVVFIGSGTGGDAAEAARPILTAYAEGRRVQ